MPISSGRSQITLAVVGLRFGAEFVPIYQQHPEVGEVVLCDPDAARLEQVGNRFGITRRFADLDTLLMQSDIDAVHLLTPLPLHAAQAVQVLEAGKHCACAVTIGQSLPEVVRVLDAERRTGKNYMMMETAVYSREFLFVQDLYARGLLGELTFLRGAYFQDAEGYPDYWKSVPPMHYSTHVLAPLLALSGTRVAAVSCLGSGLLSPRLQQLGANPFRLETALFRLENAAVAAQITRSWFETAHPYTESFSVYGTQRSFEWSPLPGEKPSLFTLGDQARPFAGRAVSVERVTVPDYADRLPPALRPFTQYATDGAHGGSHPHLAHEFVRSIAEGQRPAIDAAQAAEWTVPGLCAHQSAMQEGAWVSIPNMQRR